MERRAVVPTYRDTTLGNALQDTLREMIQSGEINESTRDTILQTFDVTIFEQFAQMPRTRPTKLTGNCPSYNNSFRESSDLCLIVSMNARNNPIEAAPEEVTRNSKRGRGQRGAAGRHN
jgi:hypothetical protein